MKKTLVSLALALVALLPAVAFAQTVPAETTTTAAITNTSTTSIPLTSTSTAPTTAWVAGNFLWIDSEAMLIRSISGLNVLVIRGQLGTVSSQHKNGAVVYAAFPGHFFSSQAAPGGPPGLPQGGGTADGAYCVRSQWLFQPQIDTFTGNVWSCAKGTTNTWMATNVYNITFNSMTVSPF